MSLLIVNSYVIDRKAVAGVTLGGGAFDYPSEPPEFMSIGTPGADDFGIGYDLDLNTPVVDPVHTASLSIM